MLMPICQAIEEATGQRISPPTATRWAMQGCGGVVLKSVKLGKKRLSRVEWVNDFIAARSQPPKTQKPPERHARRELHALLGR